LLSIFQIQKPKVFVIEALKMFVIESSACHFRKIEIPDVVLINPNHMMVTHEENLGNRSWGIHWLCPSAASFGKGI
jgi:hypothetical protein